MLSETEDTEDELLLAPSQLFQRRPKTPFRLHLLTFLSAIGGFLFGYDTGVVSGAMVLIRREWNLSNLWQETIVSATILAACFTSLLGGVVSSWWGRKPAILLASLFFLLGSIVMGIAENPIVMLTGDLLRFLFFKLLHQPFSRF